MNLEHKDTIKAPVEVVYALVKDRLPEIVPYLPNIKKIEKLSEEVLDDDTVRIINHWYAKVEIPGLIKKFVSEELFSWSDTALWSNRERTVRYELASKYGKDFFSARGTNSFVAKDAHTTELRLACDFSIHADRIPGIPKLMAKTVVPTIEKLIERMLEPNMTSLGHGIRAYLAEH